MPQRSSAGIHCRPAQRRSKPGYRNEAAASAAAITFFLPPRRVAFAPPTTAQRLPPSKSKRHLKLVRRHADVGNLALRFRLKHALVHARSVARRIALVNAMELVDIHVIGAQLLKRGSKSAQNASGVRAIVFVAMATLSRMPSNARPTRSSLFEYARAVSKNVMPPLYARRKNATASASEMR